MSKLKEFVRRVPPTTLFFVVLCILVFAVHFLIGGLTECAISAYSVLHQYQIYRIFTSAFTHLSLMHILLNMVSYYSMNPILERKYGSVFMFYMVLLFTLVNGLLYVLIHKLLSFISYQYLYTSAAGFSGVLFSLLTTYSYFSEEESLSLFGLFSVPRQWYAVTYLIILSILMPNSSFVGHLSGIISGFFFCTGYLNWLIPMHFLHKVEKSFIGSWMKKSDAFIYFPEIHETIGSTLSFKDMIAVGYEGLKTLVVNVCKLVVKVVRFCFDSVFPPVLNASSSPSLPVTSSVEATVQKSVSRGISDVENQMTAEEVRRQRLAALGRS